MIAKGCTWHMGLPGTSAHPSLRLGAVGWQETKE